jgi:hypothetical protein
VDANIIAPTPIDPAETSTPFKVDARAIVLSYKRYEEIGNRPILNSPPRPLKGGRSPEMFCFSNRLLNSD